MINEIIELVHYIAERQKCPAGFTSARMDGTPILLMNDNILTVDDDISEDGSNDEVANDSATRVVIDEQPYDNDKYMDAVQNLGNDILDQETVDEIIHDPDYDHYNPLQRAGVDGEAD